MLPPRIADTFARVPDELVALCRPHRWEQLTAPPGEGMRPICDILVHLIGAEAYWIGHVVRGGSRPHLSPEDFADLDAILSRWKPQREATLAFLAGLTPEAAAARRPFPWDASQSASVAEIAWHVVTHEQYHRGQIVTRLALLGRRDLPDHDLIR
ncbi:MAG: DinB family protein [Armatimonadetes bacterium]|nr:DinB family protein [Armatimonadota bacterium]